MNPQYDWAVPAADQVEYANPVTVNNQVLLLANYAIEVTQSIVATNRKIRDAKEALKAAKHAKDDFQYDLMRTYPPPATATKSLALMEAFVRNSAFVAGTQEQYIELRKAVNAAELAMERLDIDLDASKQVWDTVKLLGIHLQTFLSFVKSDKKSGAYV